MGGPIRRLVAAGVIVQLLCWAGTRAEAARRPLERALDPAGAAEELDAVLREVRQAHESGERLVVVFDIDDTLIRWKRAGGRQTGYSPMAGGPSYVRALARAGARIVYLTGRNEKAYGAQTRALLRSLRLPLGGRHRLLMNPLPEDTPAVEWKAQARGRVLGRGRVIALFDDDLANVRLFRRQYPGARVFRLAGHSGTADPEAGRGADGIRVIGDFVRTRTRPALARTRALRGMNKVAASPRGRIRGAARTRATAAFGPRGRGARIRSGRSPAAPARRAR